MKDLNYTLILGVFSSNKIVSVLLYVVYVFRIQAMIKANIPNLKRIIIITEILYSVCIISIVIVLSCITSNVIVLFCLMCLVS